MSDDEECYCAALMRNEGPLCVFCELATDARLERLAKNLVIACMLDRAWSLGYAAAGDAYGMTDGTEWQPGTGRPAP